MKFISSIGFLIVFGLSLKIGLMQQRRMLQKLRSKNTGVVGYGVAMLGLLLVFVQFWCLTRIFPSYVILALVAASFLGVMIHNLIGAIAGFGVKQKQSRINILVITYAAQRKAAGVAMIVGSLFLLLGVPIGALYKFWKFPIGASEAVAWIAFFLFIIPQIFSIVLNLAGTLPTITSEYVDNDVRNYLLSGQFSSVIYSTVTLIFPVLIFSQFPSTLDRWMLPGWMILSVPSLIFLVCYLPPYFVGARKYRAELKTELEWRKEWLKEMGEVLTLPEPSRTGSIQEKNSELTAKITETTEANELHKFINDLEGIEAAAEANPNPALDILRLIYENRENLKDWDVRYREICRLQQLSSRVSQPSPGDLGPYITSAKTNVTDDITALSTEKTVIAGGIWTVMTAVGPWVLKAYQDPILAGIGKLFQHS